MGRDKASLPWGGVPLGVFVARKLETWFEEVIVSSSRPGPFAGLPYRIAPDRFRDAGTLAGLHGSLEAARRDWVFLTACDMPFVREALVRLLWSMRDGADIVACRWDEYLEPLCALYATTCLDPVRRALESGERRVFSFFDAVEVRFLDEAVWRQADPEGLSFRNINTPEEYERNLPASETDMP
jgi:molybdopterin-guanine dinucleotide biosynthesis protein A